jgi:tetratricopeptide (TPR) repeat protein
MISLILLLVLSAADDAFQRGELLMQAGRYEDAAKQYVDALVANPNHSAARAAWRQARYEIATRKAQDLTMLRRLDEARRWTEAAREFAPATPQHDWRPWAALAGAGYVISLICTLYFGLRFAVSNTECR